TKPLDQSFSFYYNQQNTVTIPDYDSLCEYKWYEFEPSYPYSAYSTPIGKSYTFTSNITPKTLYVTQSKHSCESAPATYTLCGITKPVVSIESIEITTAEELPTISSLATLLPNEQLVWIESDKEFISQSYTPKHSFPGTYSIQVYTTNSATSCTSPPISIPVTILPCGNKPTPTSDTIVKILHNQPAPTFQTAETNIVWFDARHNQIAEGNSYTPQNLRPGTYVFYAHTVNENCKSASQSFTVTVDGYHISGTVFFDRNEDGVQQAEDNLVAGQLLYIEEADMYISTQANGKFTWNTPEYGTYTIRLVNKLATNQLLSDIAVPVTIDQEHLSVNTITFRYKVNTAHNIGVDISNSSSPVVGRDFTVYCYNKNFGNIQYNVLTTITYDNTKCTLKSVSKPYHTHIGNEIEFIDDAIIGNSYSYFTLTFTVLPNPNLTNQVIAIYSTIESALVDAVPQNNIDSLKLTILNSQDPNDKAVTPSYKENGYVLMNSKLEYKIRFQNKGTAEAWDIYIRDTIDEHLDLSTFNVLASSHDMYYTMQGRVITFYFDSIMLPAEMYDEPGSNGFIDYEISPLPNVPEETQVFNTAHIFFDFNPAVVTNTTTSTYVVALPKEEELPDDITVVQREISLVPNPVETETTITIDAQGTKYLIVQNATGTTVFETTFEGNTYVLDCRTMQPGLYVCSIICNGKVYTEKYVKK
ncbi:MAG TPA: T9SS type A sorting domain-containing protein, partial [Bacteroidales bacterium]|nr:T9SS type A sorting domain-containing protein [Bacteroidales bacterium]